MRIGLSQVRDYRLRLLEQEEKSFGEEMRRRVDVMPDMAPVLLVRVEGEAHE